MQDQRKADRNQSSGTESSSSDPCCEHKDAVCWSLHRSHQQTRPRSHPTRPTFLEGEARPRECRDRSTVRLGTMQISSSVPSCKRDGWRVPRQLKRCRLRQSRSPTFRRTHRASKDGGLLSRPFSTDPLTGAAAAVPRWLAAARTRPGSETDSEVARQATLRGCCRMERRRSTNVTPPSHGVDRRHDKRANLPCHRQPSRISKTKILRIAGG